MNVCKPARLAETSRAQIFIQFSGWQERRPCLSGQASKWVGGEIPCFHSSPTTSTACRNLSSQRAMCQYGNTNRFVRLNSKKIGLVFLCSVSLLFSSIKFRYLERQPRLGRKPPPMTIHRNWSITCHWLYNYCYLDSAIWRKPLPFKVWLSYLEGRAILYVTLDKYLSAIYQNDDSI